VILRVFLTDWIRRLSSWTVAIDSG
jgi:hypothetical protein